MTTFNAVASIMSLDDYYTDCVDPKPLIPARYPGASGRSRRPDGHRQAARHQDDQARQAVHRQVGHRQAGHLRSYKDLGDSDDDEDEVVVVADSVTNSPKGSAESDYNSNVSQINYEMADFNRTYCDESSPWKGDSSSSQQWRHNGNRPQPNAGQKSNVMSRMDLGCKNRWQKRNWPNKPNWNRNHNGNYNKPGFNQNRGQQQGRNTSMEQRMRSAYNSFRENNNLEQSAANVPMNHNVQTIPQNPPAMRNNMGFSSTITSLIDSVSNLTDNRSYNRSYARNQTTMPLLIDANVAGGASNPIDVDGPAPDDCSARQVARHIMLMMSAVRNNDTQATPEFFKNKKAMNGAD